VRLLTVCAAAQAPHAAVLARSFGGPAEVLVAERARGEHAALLAAMYAPAALAAALVPFALAAALEDDPGPVAYLAPDARVLAGLPDAAPGATLVPRRLDGAAGEAAFDDGFVALAGEAGLALARWWADRVLREGLGTAWLDRLPAMGPVAVLRDPGAGVAPWNLDERALGGDGDALTARGEPVRWVRLPGAEPGRPDVLPGVPLSRHPALAALLARHAAELAEAAAAAGEPPAARDRTFDGLPLDARLRRLFAAGHRAGR